MAEWKANFHAFLTSRLELSCQLHAPAAFLPGKYLPGLTGYMAECDPQAFWIYWKKKLFPHQQSNSAFPGVQPWPSHYTDDATPPLKPELPQIMTVPIYVSPFIYSDICLCLNFCFARTTVWIIWILKGHRSSRKQTYFLKLGLTGRWIWTGPLGRDAE